MDNRVSKRDYFSEDSRYTFHYYVLQPIVIKIAPFFYRNNITPNMITTLRLFLTLVVFLLLYCIYKNKQNKPVNVFLFGIIGILIFFQIISDDLDGYLARKHNQITKIGKYYDGIVDCIGFIGVYIFIYLMVGKKRFLPMLPIIIIPIIIHTFNRYRCCSVNQKIIYTFSYKYLIQMCLLFYSITMKV
jgi:phosphatidylglycerophosphate synthase